MRDSTLTLLLQMDTYKKSYDMTDTNVDYILNSYGGTSSVFFFITELLMGFGISPFFSASVVNEVFKFHENDMSHNEIEEFKKRFKNIFNNSEENNVDIAKSKTGNFLIMTY